MSKVIIVGNGPAGISAALYTKRANIDTLIIGKDTGALNKAHAIQNYYGLSDDISGEALAQIGISQAKKIGCEIVTSEVVGIGFNKTLVVKTTFGDYEGDAVILATGAARNSPQINGLTKFEGKGVSYCAVCDAFFYKGKDVCVLGNGEYALHEASELMPVCRSVTLLTNGEDITVSIPHGLQLDTRKIAALDGDNTLQGVLFDDGHRLAVNGVFVAIGVASSGDLARKLGAVVENNKIIVNEKMETNIPALYAAGDCIGGLLQISKAVYDGAKAGTEVIKYLRAK